jgi:uncharacterized damage-inducible protein DinB
MKELLLQYARYNIWANKLMIDITLAQDVAILDTEVVSSFPSLRQTVYHTWGAESIWLQRLQLAEHPVWEPTEFAGTFEEACAAWQQASNDLLQFVEKQYDDSALIHVFQYYDLKKNSYKTPVYQALHHVFNHGTYHRGQLITMLRQLGVTKLPSTDFITYVRHVK